MKWLEFFNRLLYKFSSSKFIGAIFGTIFIAGTVVYCHQMKVSSDLIELAKLAVKSIVLLWATYLGFRAGQNIFSFRLNGSLNEKDKGGE